MITAGIDAIHRYGRAPLQVIRLIGKTTGFFISWNDFSGNLLILPAE